MKGKKQDMGIGKLFRQKLEGVDIFPDASVRSKLMRKLAWKEFMHFNPVKFNIYYLGSILIISIAATMVFTSGPINSKPPAILFESVEVKTDSSISGIKQTISQNVGRSDKNSPGLIRKMPAMNRKDLSVKDTIRDTRQGINMSINATAVNDSFGNEMIFGVTPPDKGKLQGGIKSVKDLFEPSSSEGCTPLKLHFINRSDSYDSCKWTFGDGGYSTESNPDWIFDVAGKYKVVLELFAAGELRETAFRIITVYPKPVARFEISPEKAVIPDDEILLYNYSTDALHFNWDFGDGNTSELFEPHHKYEKSGNYNVRLIAYSDKGCSDSLYVMNAFSGSGNFIDFPNAFIPNPQGPGGGYYSSQSDESAQIFHPVHNGISDYQLKIFSKIGIQIFESRDINIGWDGYLNGQLCSPGVYIWKVRGKYLNGEYFTKLGDVTLLGTGSDH